MPLRRRLAWLLSFLVLLLAPAPAALAAPPIPAVACSAEDYRGDPRLGPAVLPDRGVVGRELRGYRRFGKLSASGFLARHWDPAANDGRGGWRYPPADGFVIGRDGKPVKRVTTLVPRQRVDRFGSEYGAFLARYGERYARRSIPPQNLDNAENPAGCNWRAYVVRRAFRVEAGPVAPAFEQPGRGIQYKLDGALVPGSPARLNVLWLVENGYLARLN
ncbi:TNT domain-containing protein [Actinomadura kijaniata]|uniref:TNT domain-containing protein n=1 Tax=Actinomadura kijaniata TaxID=46161 RepID=UPI00083494AD|nr:TNT domain-containing protein [Actinomadura kijaniata]